MKVTFFINYLNHHQAPVADEMYKLLGDGFHFVATLPRDNRQLKGGEDYSLRPYCIMATESDDAHRTALELAESADVCLFGACSQEYAVRRAVHNPNGLAFETGERWLKRGLLNLFSPVLRSWWLNYHRYYCKANFYKLCSGTFVASDDMRLGCYKGRHFKWGYFTDVPSDYSFAAKPSNKEIRLMWCARFIEWKHPEIAIDCAKRLKDQGYNFQLEMYGDGPIRGKCEEMVKRAGLYNEVIFHGNVHNTEIRQAMKASDIFLFTSDRQEGWGVVANEAMASGCCIVASDRIGAAYYLVRNGGNGYTFRDRDAGSLFKAVKHLIDNPQERIILSKQASNDMSTIWNPNRAALNLLQLIDDLQAGNDTSIIEGPCSKA